MTWRCIKFYCQPRLHRQPEQGARDPQGLRGGRAVRGQHVDRAVLTTRVGGGWYGQKDIFSGDIFWEASGNLQVSTKGPGDFVTSADKRTEKIIIEELQKAHPDYGFVTEESGIINKENNPNK